MSAVLGPVRFPQTASCLVFHSFFLVYFMPSHVQGMPQSVCLSGNPAWGSYLSQSITRNLWWRWMSSAQSGNVPLGSLPSGVWHWRHCWCQMCPSSCTCCQCPEPPVELPSTAHSCVLASGNAGSPRSWKVKANHQVLSPIFFNAFATQKFSRHFKCILYSFP